MKKGVFFGAGAGVATAVATGTAGFECVTCATELDFGSSTLWSRQGGVPWTYTGVPTSAISKKSFAIAAGMRTQPWDAG